MNTIREVFNILLSLIRTIGFWDIVDIVLVAYIIYLLVTFVRKTSSGGVVKGIILIIAAMWLSSVFHLNAINFLLGQTVELGILALIILFQPELRRFLGQVGNRSSMRGIFGWTFNVQAMEAVISNVVLACADMAQTKTGVLIVFERDIKLDDFIKTGTLMDSEITSELLKNIFYPKTPLHDGAVIIRGDRIQSASSILPISSNTNLGRDLGMRHKAAIGMSERTDAVVVIVSEETGNISVAIKGMLKRHLSVDTFEKLLKNELIPVTDKASQKKSILRKFFKVKNNAKDDEKKDF